MRITNAQISPLQTIELSQKKIFPLSLQPRGGS
jgi:hypothetical protein